MLFDKIKALCSINGTNVKQLEKELGLGNGTISKWNGRYPSADRLAKVARYFNVSIEYLLGVEEPAAAGQLTKYEKEYLDLIRMANEETKKHIIGLLRAAADIRH